MGKYSPADERGVGGRLLVELDRYNMNRKVYNAKSTIDTGLTQRKSTLTRGQSPKAWVGGYKTTAGGGGGGVRHSTEAKKLAGRPVTAPPGAGSRKVGTSGRASQNVFQEIKDWAEVKETYRRVSNVTAYGHKNSGQMMQPPKTLGLAKKLSENRQRRLAQTDRTLHEHKNNLYHMKRRMQENYSLTERKKNVFDASLYPSYLLRKTPKADHTVASSFHRLLPDGGSVPGRPAGAMDLRGSVSSSVGRGRPGSAPPQGRVGGGGWEKDRYHASPPRRDAQDPDEDLFAQYRESLMDQIVESRIYEERRLNRLFANVLKQAPPEHVGVVQGVVLELKRDLDVEDDV